jgi:ABC-type branched-subunit amino acid transport system substrate-binding protein
VRPGLRSSSIGRRPFGRASRAVAIGLVAILALTTAACGNSPSKETTSTSASGSDDSKVAVDQPGVTDTEIRVGGVASTTNPLGGLEGDAFNGVQAYFDMVNDAGGLYGRKLVLAAERDDKLANNAAETQGLLTQDNVFAVLPIATLLFTGADLLVQQNVPSFGWNINGEWSGTPENPRANLFGQAGSYLCFTCATPVLPWLAREAGSHKVGQLAYNVPQSTDCATGNDNSFAKFGPETDSSIVFTDKSLAFGTADLSVQVSKMKDAGVDFVLTCMDTNGVVTLAKEMKKQGLKAPQVLPNGYDHTFVSEFGDLFEDSYVRTDFVQLEVEDKPEGLQNFVDWMDKAGKEPSENSIVGWLNADLFVRGLEAAGPNFSRQSLIDAINQMTDYTADGMLDGVDWTRQHTEEKSDTSFCQFFSQISDSEFHPIFSQPDKPFICVVIDGDEITSVNE